MKKVPRSHFERFKKEVLRQIDRLGLKDWDVDFKFDDLSPDAQEAKIEMNYKIRKASFFYSTRLLGDRLHSGIGPIVAAKHEVAHLLVFELACIGASRFITDDEIRIAEEKLVTILSKVL